MSQSEKPTSSASVSDTLSWGESGMRALTGNTVGDFLVERMLGRGGMGEVYPLGVTFDHMLAGVLQCRAETPLALALQHVTDAPVSLAVHRPDLVRLVMTPIARNLNDRNQSAAEVLRDLARSRESLQTQAAAVPEGGDIASGSTDGVALRTTGGTPHARVDLGPWICQLAGFRPGHPLLSGLVALGLAWGWLTRPPDLLSASSKSSATIPALWMAPAWSAISRRNSGEEQYLDTQLQATRDDQVAAWLAGPGNFLSELEYDVKASSNWLGSCCVTTTPSGPGSWPRRSSAGAPTRCWARWSAPPLDLRPGTAGTGFRGYRRDREVGRGRRLVRAGDASRDPEAAAGTVVHGRDARVDELATRRLRDCVSTLVAWDVCGAPGRSRP